LIHAGVARVVIAAGDPDPRVSGKGTAMLREAGIETVTGVLEDEAARLNEGFFRRVTEGRPMVTLKVATSLDGRIATASGASKWITGEAARAHGHLLRARHDAILTGVGTVISDDPELTCRLPGLLESSPLRVVVDSWLRLPEGSHIVQSARSRPTLVATLGPADPEKKHALLRRGVEIIEVEADADGHPAPLAVLQALGLRGVTRLLLEAGTVVNTAFLKAGLVDHIAWYRAASLFGGDALAVVEGLGIARPDQAPMFARENNFTFGADLLETYRRAY
jgi:diaminohydroxyphosphoribosylaminopyrimidine deaminase/5-amino-6-(5-phosphoribosylamino)uracil reductase